MEEPEREFDQKQYVLTGKDWLRSTLRSVEPDRRVRASRAGLDVEGSKFIPHEAITSAFYAPRTGGRGRVIVIAKNRPRVVIEVLTRDEAKRLLAALGFGADRKQLTFTAESTVARHSSFSFWMLVVMVAFGIFGEMNLPRFDFANSFFSNAAIFLAAGAFLAWFLRPSVVVGADGIAVRTAAFGPRKFISYDDIAHVRHLVTSRNDQSGEFDHVLFVEKKSGDELRVELKRGERNEDDAAGLVERIQEAIDARSAHEIPATVESILERGDRSANDWLEALRKIQTSGEVHYRVAAFDRESLFTAVEDATKKPETRIAAAIALGKDLDDDGRKRLRVTADSIAEPKLRVALEHVADGADADRLIEALDDLDAMSKAEG